MAIAILSGLFDAASKVMIRTPSEVHLVLFRKRRVVYVVFVGISYLSTLFQELD